MDAQWRITSTMPQICEYLAVLITVGRSDRSQRHRSGDIYRGGGTVATTHRLSHQHRLYILQQSMHVTTPPQLPCIVIYNPPNSARPAAPETCAPTSASKAKGIFGNIRPTPSALRPCATPRVTTTNAIEPTASQSAADECSASGGRH